ncbi:hypothetical protein [Sphingobium indicum]|uniref:Uncharacterized protein n=1 Tax=Sphingobium indicum (strain DSM 16412 / CCM 7286 / MTCC 6364 / B90A) TaxID=861109 RepID=A0A1L5BMV9_SPHIB|nr:hypothetical protein [Sphingobium indicum]APL94107.1 hypothetical protein SIDU_06075 [Sphingobium indicum B90A]
MRNGEFAFAPGRDGKNLHEAGRFGCVGLLLGLQRRVALHLESLCGGIQLLGPDRAIVDECGNKAAEDKDKRLIGLWWNGHSESPFAAPVAQGGRA